MKSVTDRTPTGVIGPISLAIGRGRPYRSISTTAVLIDPKGPLMSSSASLAPSSASSRPRLRTVLLLLAGIVVAGAANAIVAATALAAGASSAFPPLMPAVFLAFTTVGLIAGYVGWRIVRRITPNSRRVLTWLVPIALVLSWTPDIVLMATGFIPGTTITGAVALMLMHPIVVAVGVPLYQRLAPAR
jgi:hypothetical protein